MYFGAAENWAQGGPLDLIEKDPKHDVTVYTETSELSNVSSISEVPRQMLHFAGNLESSSSLYSSA